MAIPALELHGIPERPRILVAEDQTDVVMALHLLLKRNGYEAEFVKCPEEALQALRTRPFDAALLDLNYSRNCRAIAPRRGCNSTNCFHESTLRPRRAIDREIIRSS